MTSRIDESRSEIAILVTSPHDVQLCKIDFRVGRISDKVDVLTRDERLSTDWACYFTAGYCVDSIHIDGCVLCGDLPRKILYGQCDGMFAFRQC